MKITSYIAKWRLSMCICIYSPFIIAICVNQCLAVEGGFRLQTDHWASVVRLSNAKSLCSGIHVKRRYVLTAAHCVDRVGETWSIEVQKRTSTPTVDGTVVYIDPEYNSDRYVADLAVIELSSPLDAPEFGIQSSEQYLRMLQLIEVPSSDVFLVGYGQDEVGLTGSRKGAIVSGSGIFQHGDHIYGHWSTRHGGASLPGDSGGPVFALYGNTPVVIAVVSGDTVWESRVGEDQEDKETVERFSPIVPSLCRASQDLRKSLGFRSGACPKVQQFAEEIKAVEGSPREKLWKALQIENSRIEVRWIRLLKFQLVLDSLLLDEDSYLFYELAGRFPSSKFGIDSALKTEKLKALDEKLRSILRDYDSEMGQKVDYRWRLRQWFSTLRPSVDERQLDLYSEFHLNRGQAFKCGVVPCTDFLRAISGPLKSHYGNSWTGYLRSIDGEPMEVGWSEFNQLLCRIDVDWVASDTAVPSIVADKYSNVFSVESTLRSPSEKQFRLEARSAEVSVDMKKSRMILGFNFTGEVVPPGLLARYERSFGEGGFSLSPSPIGVRASGGPSGSFAIFNRDDNSFSLFAKDAVDGFSHSLSTYREFLQCSR